jgi:PKD repeat protein
LAALLVATGAMGQPASSVPAATNARAERSMRATEVLQTLRERLPEVARVNGLQAAEVESLFGRERDLWIDRESRLFFVCEGLVLADGAQQAVELAAAASTPTAVVNSADAFKLHSLPGSNRVIYLDFNGHTTSGTQWNNNKTGGADIVSAPFDMDGNPGNWSADELARIKAIWSRVAEDYMPFAVDVTTEDPGVEALRKTSSSDDAYGVRVVISPSSAWYGSAGGVAYLGSFNWNSDTPCFIFSDKLGPNSEKAVAEAAAHEAGHTLGLSHDGKTDGTSYYSGQGNWAPIMGVSYYKSVTQWSKGEYALANNTEDDLAKMATYGAPLLNDDFGNDLASAATLSGTSISALGVIEKRGDVDVFKFTTGAGTIVLNVAGTSPEGNLDIKAELLNSAGGVIATSDPAGLSASISAGVASGTYYLRIDGVGTGDPATTGYSDYASVGEYRVTGNLISSATTNPPVAVASANTTSTSTGTAINFSSAGSADSDGSIASYSWNFGDGSWSNTANPSHAYSAAGVYTVTLTVVDNSGLSSSNSVSVSISAPTSTTPAWNAFDGSFEATGVGGSGYSAYVYNPAYPNFNFAGSSGLAGNGSGFTASNPSAPGGAQVAFIQQQGNVSTTLRFDGGSYRIKALIANRANWGSGQTVAVLIDGQAVGFWTAGTNYVQAYSNSFSVSAGNHTLGLAGQSSADATLLVDQLGIEAVATSNAVAVGTFGFENPALSANTYSAFQYAPATVAGSQDWVFSGNSGVSGNGSGFTAGNASAPEGGQVAFLQTDNSLIRQTLSFPKTGSYTLTVKAAKRGNWSVTLQSAHIMIDGAVISAIAPTSTDYTTFTVTFSTTQGSHELGFQGTANSDSTLFIDQVQIVAN